MGKLLLALAVLALGIFLFGCITVKEKLPIIGGQEEPEPEVQVPEAPKPAVQDSRPCFQIASLGERDSCLSDLAKATVNMSMCELIYGEQALQGCVSSFANLNLQACMRVSDQGQRDSCLYLHAMNLRNASLCGIISGTRLNANCTAELVPPCSGLGAIEKGKCLAWRNRDYSQCRDGNCLFDYALEFKELGACSGITDEARRLACMGAVDGQPKCANASKAAVADLCYYQYAIYSNDSYWCGVASKDTDYQDKCYIELAAGQKDIRICGSISSTIVQDDCFSNYANKTRSLETCKKIFSEGKKDTCYRNLAINYGYMEYCNKMSLVHARNLCYTAVAFGENPMDPKGCEGVADAGWKDKCYLQAATRLLDKSYCQMIASESAKKGCLEKFES